MVTSVEEMDRLSSEKSPWQLSKDRANFTGSFDKFISFDIFDTHVEILLGFL